MPTDIGQHNPPVTSIRGAHAGSSRTVGEATQRAGCPALVSLLNKPTLASSPLPVRAPAAAPPPYRSPLRHICNLHGAVVMIDEQLSALKNNRSVVAFEAKTLQELILALADEPQLEQLQTLACDRDDYLAIFTQEGIQFPDLVPDPDLQRALQALTDKIKQLHARRPDMKPLSGTQGFLAQAAHCREVLASSTNPQHRLAAVALWLRWQWAAVSEAEQAEATGRQTDVAHLAHRYGLCEGGKDAKSILKQLWDRHKQRYAARIAGSATVHAAPTHFQQ